MHKNKKILLVFLLTTCLVGVLTYFLSRNTSFFKSDLVGGTTSGSTLSGSVLGTFTDLGWNMSKEISMYGGVWDKNEDGDHIFYTILETNPTGKFVAINVTKKRFEKVQNVPSLTSWTAIRVGKKIYIGGMYDANLYVYDLVTKELTQEVRIGVADALYSMTTDGTTIYMGSHPGDVYAYNTVTKTLRTYTGITKATYSKAVVYHNGFVYAFFGGSSRDGTPPKREILKIDVNSGIAESLFEAADAEIPDALFMQGETLIQYYSRYYIYALAPDLTWKVLAGGYDMPSAPFSAAHPTYFSLAGNVYGFEEGTYSFGKVLNANSVKDFVDTEEGKIYSMSSNGLASIHTMTGALLEEHMISGMQGTTDLYSDPYHIAVENGVYVSGHNSISRKAFITDDFLPSAVSSQTKVLALSSGSLIAATYPDGNVWKYPPDVLKNPKETNYTDAKYLQFSLLEQYKQMRPRAIEVSGSGVLIGTEPSYDQYGGALTYYDTISGAHETIRDIVPRQSISAVAFDKYNAQIVYAGSFNQGGTSTTQVVDDTAHMIQWDRVTKQILFDFPIPGRQVGESFIVSKIESGRDGLLYVQAGRFNDPNLSTIYVLDPKTKALRYTVPFIYDMQLGNADELFVIDGNGHFAKLDKEKRSLDVLKEGILERPEHHSMTMDASTGVIYYVSAARLWSYTPPFVAPPTKDLTPAFTNYGTALTSMAINSGVTVKNEQGQSIFYSVIEGSPQSKFIRFNLDTKKLEQEIMISALGVWTVKEYKGKIYVGTTYPGKLLEYSIENKTLTELGQLPDKNEYIWDMAIDDENIYMGTYSGDPYRYNFAEKKMISLGHLSESKYSKGIALLGNKLYVSFGGARNDGGLDQTAQLFEIDVKNGTKRNLLETIPTSLAGVDFSSIFIGKMIVVQGKIVCFIQNNIVFEYDPSTEKFALLFNGGKNPFPATFDPAYQLFPGIDGYIYGYNGQDPNWKKLVATSISSLPATISGYDVLSPTTYRAVTSDGKVIEVDLTGKVLSSTKLTDMGVEGPIAIPWNTLAAHDDKVIVSGTRLRVFDTVTGLDMHKTVNGQAKVIAFLGDTLYTANYTLANIWKYDQKVLSLENTDNFASFEKFKQFDIEESQTRPKWMTATGSRLAVGTEPNYGTYGGALFYHDASTGEKYTQRNIVKDQTINQVVFDDHDQNILYLASSTEGGTGSNPVPGNAHIVKWNVQEKKILFDVIPDHPALGYMPHYQSMVVKNGKIYASSAYGDLYVLDSTTGDTLRSRHSLGLDTMLLASDGVIYASKNVGFGMLDEKTLSFQVLKADSAVLYGEMTEDLVSKNIYMVSSRDLWKFSPRVYQQILKGLPQENISNSNSNISENNNTNIIQVNSNIIENTNINTIQTNNNSITNENKNIPVQNLNQNSVEQSNVNSVQYIPEPTVYRGAGYGGNFSTVLSTITASTTLKSSAPTLLPVPFKDIANKSQREAIEYLYRRGIIQGKRADTFAPDALLNRAEALSLIVKAFPLAQDASAFMKKFLSDHPTYSYVTFKDVPVKAWFAGFVGLAKQEKIISGKTQNIFAPGDSVTRAEFVKMLLQSSEAGKTCLKGYDLGSAKMWYTPYLRCSLQLQITTAADNALPDRKITRAEAAFMLWNGVK